MSSRRQKDRSSLPPIFVQTPTKARSTSSLHRYRHRVQHRGPSRQCKARSSRRKRTVKDTKDERAGSHKARSKSSDLARAADDSKRRIFEARRSTTLPLRAETDPRRGPTMALEKVSTETRVSKSRTVESRSGRGGEHSDRPDDRDRRRDGELSMRSSFPPLVLSRIWRKHGGWRFQMLHLRRTLAGLFAVESGIVRPRPSNLVFWSINRARRDALLRDPPRSA